MESLSACARAWLDRVGVDRRPERALYPDPDPALREAQHRFEERWGGLRIDAGDTNIELGVGLLQARGITPERLEGPPRLLIGTEEDADLWLDGRGRLWLGGPDRDVGLFADSVEKYLEREASSDVRRWTTPSFGLQGSPLGPALAKILHLETDVDVTDATFLRADSDRWSLQAALQGTTWRTSFLRLDCRDFDALFDALRAAAALPDWTASVVAVEPLFTETRVQVSEAPDAVKLEARLAHGSLLRVPSADGGAIHLYEGPRRLEAYGLGEGRAVDFHLRGGPTGGAIISYFHPWPR